MPEPTRVHHPDAGSTSPAPVAVQETLAQRLDREHDQLLQELRALITGVQVLFAFLLSVAFTERFAALSVADRRVYLTVVGCAALALVLLLAPAAFHRVRFRQRDKEALVRLANAEAIAAMVLISITIAGSTYLVASIAFGTGWGAATAAALLACSTVVWWVIPLRRRVRDGSRGAEGDHDPGRSDLA